MTAHELKVNAQAAYAHGNRREVSRLVAIAVARLASPNRPPLASLAGHIRALWLIA
jgi:hypothetical protein